MIRIVIADDHQLVREGLVRARALRDGEAHDHVMYGLVDMQRLKSWLPAGKD